MLTVPGSVLTAPCESMGWAPDYRHVTDEENKARAHCQGAGDPDASRGILCETGKQKLNRHYIPSLLSGLVQGTRC